MTTYIAQLVQQMIPPTQNLKSTERSNYKPGDLVRIECQAEVLPPQKVWDGCWGIIQSTTNAHVRVLVGSKEVDYMARDLNRDDVLEVQFRETCERILALWQTKLEAIEQTVLQELQRRQFFTDLEIQIICFMEAKLPRASQAPFGRRGNPTLDYE